MKKTYRVKHKQDFDKIIKQGKKIKNDVFIVYYSNNDVDFSRFGISVGKKLGNAVYRNKKKRQIRSIVQHLEKKYVKKKDYIIILREQGKCLEYEALDKKLKMLLERKEQK